MKKAILPLLPLLLLNSCATNPDAEDVLSRSQAFVSTLEESEDDHYEVAVTGHVLHFDTFDEPRARGYSVPTGALEGQDYGESYILHAPLRITKENFYPAAGVETSSAVYTYGFIRERLTWQYDSRTSLCFTSDEDSMTFYVEGLSKNITFYNVVTMDDDPYTPEPDDPFVSSVSLYSRYDIFLTYNREGLLVEETIRTQDPITSDFDKTVEATGTYTYSVSA